MLEKKEAVCETCGVTFKFTRKSRGRNPRYCSTACRKEGLRLYRLKWRHDKKENDKEYYRKRAEAQALIQKKRYADLKEVAILTIVKDVAEAETAEQIREIIESRCRVRQDYALSFRNGAV